MKRREFFTKVGMGSAALASLPALSALAKPAGQDDQDEGHRERKFRWVIGGEGAALANDGSKITLTGSGTFEPGEPNEVTGWGNWTLSTGESGTYRVTALVRFELAPGRLPNPPNPGVAAIRAGLAFLRIAYSDGSRGILVVSCHLPGHQIRSLRESPGPKVSPITGIAFRLGRSSRLFASPRMNKADATDDREALGACKRAP